MRVAVVFGGRSNEHAISCVSAGSILRNLDPQRFEVVAIGITPEGAWVLTDGDPDALAISQPAAARGDRAVGHRTGPAGGSAPRRPTGFPFVRGR